MPAIHSFKINRIYFKFKEEFIHPPIAIEAKGYGAVMGSLEEYAKLIKTVVLVTPERTYEPKRENLIIIRIENKRRLSNLEIRNKLKELYHKYLY